MGLLLLLPAALLASAHADAGHAHHHHGHHHEKQHAHAGSNGGGGSGWATSPWVQAFASTTLISVVPTLVLPLIPLAKRGADERVALNEELHKTLLSFAAGGLLGEVFLHSLPHLLEAEEAEEGEGRGHQGPSHDGHGGHEHHHHGAAERVSLWVLFGFLAFFAAEKLARVLLGEDGGHGHTHGHGHAHVGAGGKDKAKIEDSGEEEGDEDSEEGEGMDSSGSVDAQGLRRRSRRIVESHGRKQQQQQQRAAPGGAGSSPRKESSNGRVAASKEGGSWAGGLGLEKLKASGYLNITLDLAHNLTDGIAIGASFAASASRGGAGGGGGRMGLATTLSVLLHEVPHEIGDFAILVQSGMSLRAAFLIQFCTAIAAFAGTACGLVATRHEGLERVLVGLMSGGFLYVGAVSVLPELLAGKSSPRQALREVGGVLGGIWLMTLVGH